MTLGESRVRTRFNPSNNSMVDQIKQLSAEIINLTGSISNGFHHDSQNNSERFRLIELAQTAYEQAAMWAVKAATL